MLLERVLKVQIRKDQTYTDWTRRPLKPEQLAYARADVAHLLALHDRLRADLERRGRLAWVDGGAAVGSRTPRDTRPFPTRIASGP